MKVQHLHRRIPEDVLRRAAQFPGRWRLPAWYAGPLLAQPRTRREQRELLRRLKAESTDLHSRNNPTGG